MRRNGIVLGAILGLLLLPAGRSRAANEDQGKVPSWLPRYDLDMDLDLAQHRATVRQRVTWINRHERPAQELVFNAHSHYQVPGGFTDYLALAKMLELLRVPASEALDLSGPACEVQKVSVVRGPWSVAKDTELATTDHGQRTTDNGLSFHFREDNLTALVVPLPGPVARGEAVTVEIAYTFRLPQKQGRWGQWQGVTCLSNWHPVLAYYDDNGWQPTPFIPWHQPFFNEAGVYAVRVTLPADQKVACTGSVIAVQDLGDGRQQVDIAAAGARDFAFLCSSRYQEFTGQAGPVRVRVVAFPEHEHYARLMVRYACEAIETYGRWFGPYPHPEFTVAEAFFGWNGNECSGLVMIDSRVFAMPHLADGYVDYLVSHEVCHQWWYNTVGTNGYAETWMDEALATYFSHRLMDRKHGKNSRMLHFPKGLEWLPNITRDTYRYYSFYGILGRGDDKGKATVQDMPKFGHLVNLFGICYDKGSRIVGMIEERLGETAFHDFMRGVYERYQFRILRVADFQRELEAYTGRCWDEFFQNWLYGCGLTDWSVEKVTVKEIGHGHGEEESDQSEARSLPSIRARAPARTRTCKVTVLLHQKAEINEQTVLGICLDGSDNYQIRLPILPQAPLLEIDDPPARIEALPDNRVLVEVVLPCKPTQITVDPDQILVDREPANNSWKPRISVRLTPLYTSLDETDITVAYDRWNFIAGPWIYASGYNDPWFTRSTVAGFRVGAYRTQQISAGAYVGYRTDFRDVAVGVDGLWDHVLWPHFQVGFNAERSLGTIGSGGTDCNRGVLFGRHVFAYNSSLYLPPLHYVELFGSVQNNCRPEIREDIAGTDRFNQQTNVGIHYHIDYRTPYWDPETGFRFDTTYAFGVPIFGQQEVSNQLSGQFSCVQSLPDLSRATGVLPGRAGEWVSPLFSWLAETRLAARLYGAVGAPDNGLFFALGGSQLFRGFDLAERQGSLAWIASLEWRIPLAKGLTWDCCDHIAGLRNIYLAPFYDVGDVYVRGQPVGPVAHAFGAGLALDVAWFSFIEHTTLRFDVAKTVNAATPVQFWFGVVHPF